MCVCVCVLYLTSSHVIVSCVSSVTDSLIASQERKLVNGVQTKQIDFIMS